MQREDAQDVVVLMHGLAKVPSLLLVVPILIRISVRTLDRWRINIASILLPVSPEAVVLKAERTMSGSSSSGNGPGSR